MDEKNTLVNFSNLMLDWPTDLNPGIDPSKITKGSQKNVWWRCHKCGREWKTTVRNRINGTGCICDSKERKIATFRKNLVKRDGSLAERRPKIAAQWHPKLNGNLKPEDITEKSSYDAWWIDEDGAVWKSKVSTRCSKPEGTRRPKSLPVPGVNDLKTLRPDLAKEWNYEKNIGINIEDIIPGTKKRVWWICDKGHEWQATVTARNSGNGCPVCNKERGTSFPEQALFFYIKSIFSDAENRYYPEKNLELDIYIPSQKIAIEYDGGFYHSSEKKRKIDIKKNCRLKELGITLIRIIENDGTIPPGTTFCVSCERRNSIAIIDPAIEKTIKILEKLINKKFTISINSERDRTAIYEQYILAEKNNSLSEIAPEVIKEWHPTKNGKIKPEYVHVVTP